MAYGAEESYINPAAFLRGGPKDQTTDLLQQGTQQQAGILQNTGAEESANIRSAGETAAKGLPEAVTMYQQGQRNASDLATAQQQQQKNAFDLQKQQHESDFLSEEDPAGETNEEKMFKANLASQQAQARRETAAAGQAEYDVGHAQRMEPLETEAKKTETAANKQSIAASIAQINNLSYAAAKDSAPNAYQGVQPGSPEEAQLDAALSKKGLSPADIMGAKSQAQAALASRKATSNMLQQSQPGAQSDQAVLNDAHAKISALADLVRSTGDFSKANPFTPDESRAKNDVGAALHVLDPSAEQRFLAGWDPRNPGTTQTKIAGESIVRAKGAIMADLNRIEQSARASGNAQQVQQIQALRNQLGTIGTGATMRDNHNSMSLSGGTTNAGMSNASFLNGAGAPPPTVQPQAAPTIQPIQFQGKQPQGLGSRPASLRGP